MLKIRVSGLATLMVGFGKHDPFAWLNFATNLMFCPMTSWAATKIGTKITLIKHIDLPPRRVALPIVLLFLLIATPVFSALAGEIRIGATLRMTTLQGQKSGQMLGDEIDLINQNGGINGHTLKLVLLNDECKPDKGIAHTQSFIAQQRVHLIIGSTCSSVTLPMVEQVTKASIPLLVPHSTNPEITRKQSPWVFRVAVSSRFFNGASAKFLSERGVKRIAYVYTNDRLAQMETNTIIDYFKRAHNVEPVYLAQVHDTAFDFRGHLERIRGTRPDAIFYGGTADALSRFLVQSYEAGISPKVIRAGTSTAALSQVPEGAGDAARGVFYSTVYSASDRRPIAQLFNRMVWEKYGIDNPEHEFSQIFDTIRIAETALRRANLQLTGASLAADRTAIARAIAAIDNYQGLASGPISFCADATPQCRDGNRTPVIVGYVKGGRNFKVGVFGRLHMSKDFGLQ